ncbi:MAG: phosphoribosylformylglycinamidine synthase subunit PurS [Thermoplasmataceae archaeon]
MPRVRVEIEYLEGVEDPESETILRNLKIIGFENLSSVRISKSFEFNINGNRDDALLSVKEIADKLLYNPVIQRFKIVETSD